MKDTLSFMLNDRVCMALKNPKQILLLTKDGRDELRQASGRQSRHKMKKAPNLGLKYHFQAVRTGLEPATFRVTGGHSNQLNYQTISASSKAHQKGIPS